MPYAHDDHHRGSTCLAILRAVASDDRAREKTPGVVAGVVTDAARCKAASNNYALLTRMLS